MELKNGPPHADEVQRGTSRPPPVTTKMKPNLIRFDVPADSTKVPAYRTLPSRALPDAVPVKPPSMQAVRPPLPDNTRSFVHPSHLFPSTSSAHSEILPEAVRTGLGSNAGGTVELRPDTVGPGPSVEGLLLDWTKPMPSMDVQQTKEGPNQTSTVGKRGRRKPAMMSVSRRRRPGEQRTAPPPACPPRRSPSSADSIPPVITRGSSAIPAPRLSPSSVIDLTHLSPGRAEGRASLDSCRIGSLGSVIDLTTLSPRISPAGMTTQSSGTIVLKKRRVSKGVSSDIEVADTPTSTQRALSVDADSDLEEESDDKSSDSAHMDAFKLKRKRLSRQSSPARSSSRSNIAENQRRQAPPAPETFPDVPMEVEANFRPADHHSPEPRISARNSKGKMKAIEEVSNVGQGSDVVEDGRAGLLDDFHKLSFAEALPNAPDIPTLPPPIRPVPFPASKERRSEADWQITSASQAAAHLFTSSTMLKHEIRRSSSILQQLTELTGFLEKAQDSTEDALARVEKWKLKRR